MEQGSKPSYVGLLNAIALGERRGAEYLAVWESTTTNDEVRRVLHTVGLREAEHAHAFEKRLDELGFGVIPKDDPYQQRALAIAASTTMTDREKIEALKLDRAAVNGEPDIFDRFFENKDLDPVTGGLLGRYIAEERDTARLIAACHDRLCTQEAC